MISFEVNQEDGSKIKDSFWQEALGKLAETLNLDKKYHLSIGIVDEDTIRKLNNDYRGRDKVTDVLSFAEMDIEDNFEDDKTYLGEVLICYKKAVEQAKENGKSVEAEIRLLFVHGILHLFGYDHQKDQEAEIMEELQSKILN